MEPSGSELCHCHAARRAARMLSRLYDRHLAPVGLNISQFAMLSCIDRQPGLGIQALAASMVMERTTLVRALQPLRNAALVEAVKDGGRDLRYRLTELGRHKLQAAVPYWETAQAEYERQFGAERADRLRGDMLALTAQP